MRHWKRGLIKDFGSTPYRGVSWAPCNIIDGEIFPRGSKAEQRLSAFEVVQVHGPVRRAAHEHLQSQSVKYEYVLECDRADHLYLWPTRTEAQSISGSLERK